jgi:hypothetical protein
MGLFGQRYMHCTLEFSSSEQTKQAKNESNVTKLKSTYYLAITVYCPDLYTLSK